ncbi:hypothetical protein [uncultured Ruminococcus sp.]|uniref:hypothetical protein n=1 Tax=uncultured Ruminococcus sp. TaxID=165186 RepID=UPI0025EA49C7|nr:hypothetical protein [uncultured Ruminococcus sp.]
MKKKEEPVLTQEEIREFVIGYLGSKENKTNAQIKRFDKYLAEEHDVFEALIREGIIAKNGRQSYSMYERVLDTLFRDGRCSDLALREAKALADGLHFIDPEGRELLRGRGVKNMPEWSTEDEEHLRRWLACECDDLPETVPLTSIQQVHYCGDSYEEHFAALSLVCDFPLRYAAYTFYRGVVMEFKWPLRAFILYRENGFADEAVAKMREMYASLFRQTEEEIDINVMLGFAAVYCSGGKKKPETEFYQKYIEQWLSEDHDRFIGYIRDHMNGDFRSKVLKKLTGSGRA